MLEEFRHLVQASVSRTSHTLSEQLLSSKNLPSLSVAVAKNKMTCEKEVSNYSEELKKQETL